MAAKHQNVEKKKGKTENVVTTEKNKEKKKQRKQEIKNKSQKKSSKPEMKSTKKKKNDSAHQPSTSTSLPSVIPPEQEVLSDETAVDPFPEKEVMK